jgi:predicted transcriptional regulator of viral defense system
MHDGKRPDVRGLETDAYTQGGYFSAAQARAHGVSKQLLRHHVSQGRFEHVRRGLYRIRGFPTTEHDDMREKWMALGSDTAVFSNSSALALLEISDSIPDSVHLLVPRRARGLRKPSGVTLHTRPDDEDPAVVWRQGLPATAPARTIIDVLRELQPEQAAMAVQQALRRGLVTEKQLHAEAEHRGRERILDSVLRATRE